MEVNNDKATFTYEPMPTTVYDDRAARLAREKVVKVLDAITRAIAKFRENGVTIADEDELKQLTPRYIKDMIRQTRERRLGEKFLPVAIRKAEEHEFTQMERTLVPLARDLQTHLQAFPFRIHVGSGGDDQTYFNSDDVERYIEEAASVVVPPEIASYYMELQKICAAWHNLVQWCATNQFAPPTFKVLQMLSGTPDANLPERVQPCSLTLSPERMFNAWQWGHIAAIPETEKI